MSGLTIEDQNQYWSMIDLFIGACSLEMARAGYGLLDGKCELVMGPGRTKLIGDVAVTPDEDRPVSLGLLRQGIVKHYSKEEIRQKLIEMGYKKLLDAARAKGEPDPPIPRLPDEFICDIAQRYMDVAEAYSGLKLS
jgi:phosphoribosylaminoimidazole-succinocarboxamide synthase